MIFRKSLVLVVAVLLVAGIAAADLKVVKQTHRDAFTIMGQSQPADDREQTTWIGKDRMAMDQGDSATIVRLDTKKLFVVNHSNKTYNVLDLPIDLTEMLPPEMQPMLTMMVFEVKVEPTDEYKMIGDWNARRFNVTMTTQMMTITSTMWVSDFDGYDPKAFNEMYVHLNSLQPGMADAAAEMRKMNGLVVAQEGVMSMMGTEVKNSETAISIDNLKAPAGTYDPPAGYTEQPFDIMASMK